MIAKKSYNIIQLRRAVRRLVKAEITYSWRGSLQMAERAAVDREFKLARRNYDRIIKWMKENETRYFGNQTTQGS